MSRRPDESAALTKQFHAPRSGGGTAAPVPRKPGLFALHANRASGVASMLLAMPTISRFYGIVIRMYFADHAPPHFHAVYAGQEAVVAIADGEILRGALPDRALRMVREWASVHRGEPAANWDRVQVPDQPIPIAPLP